MSLVCHREIIKLDEVELRSVSFDRFSLVYVHFYDFSHWDLGIIKQKLMNYPTTEHEAILDKGSELRITERLSLRVFFFLPSYIPRVNMHFEKSRRLSVLWTIWNFSMISAEKVPGSFDFCHHRGVDFAS